MKIKSIKLWILIIAVVAICGAGTYIFMHGKAQKKTAADTQQSTATVRQGNIRSTVSGTAQFEARDMQNIIAPADGTIKTMNLTNNKAVKKGDTLVVVSDPALETNLQAAQTTLDQDEKDLADLQDQQNHLTVTAPISGKLTLNNLDLGSNVSKNGKLGTIADTSQLTVKLPFLLEDAVQLHKGDEVDLTVDGFMLTKTGVVQSVGQQTRSDSNGGKLVDVDISVRNDGTLDAGYNVKATASISGHSVDSQAKGALAYSDIEPVFADAAGTVKDLSVKTGDFVSKGGTIAVLTNDQLPDDIANKQAAIERQKITVQDAQDKLDEMTLTAPFDGVFSTDFVNSKTNVLASYPVGAKILANTQLGAVASMDYMQLQVQVDELDLQNVKVGQKAEITVDSLPGKIFEGELTQLSTVGTTTNGVTYFNAVLSVKNDSGELKYGMTATANILIQDKQNVLTLPIEAVQQKSGKHYVTLQQPDGSTTEQEVQVGAHSNTMIEITSGVKEGDKVTYGVKRTPTTNASQAEIDRIRQQFQNGGGFQGGGGFGGASGGFSRGGSSSGGSSRGGRG